MTSTIRREKLDALIANYGRHHQDPRNKAIHCICVPAILFSVVGLLVAVNFGITLIAIAAAILYYNGFGQKAAMQIGTILAIMLVIWVTVMPPHHLTAFAVGILILGWTGQFVGHFYEGSKPSFLEDAQYLLIGPLYVLAALKEKLARNPHLDSL